MTKFPINPFTRNFWYFFFPLDKLNLVFQAARHKVPEEPRQLQDGGSTVPACDGFAAARPAVWGTT